MPLAALRAAGIRLLAVCRSGRLAGLRRRALPSAC